MCSVYDGQKIEAIITWKVDLNQTLIVVVFRQLNTVSDKREFNV